VRRTLRRDQLLTLLRELFAYRVLVQSLVIRELKARYRGSVLGFLWTFLNPLLLMATYTLIFSVYMRIGMPNYPAFLLTGLLPWTWFSSSLLLGGRSIVDGGALLRKVSFPPQVLPAVCVLSNLVNFLLSLPLLFAFLLFFGLRPHWTMLALVPLMAIQLAFTFGLALILASVTVRYRDVSQLLSNLLMLWFFLSPVIYPSSQVPAAFAPLLTLNPMTPLLIGYQNALLYATQPEWSHVFASAIVSLIICVMGSTVFERFRWTFAEEV
jgi:homopolymeric O-antigen transport system permease protein